MRETFYILLTVFCLVSCNGNKSENRKELTNQQANSPASKLYSGEVSVDIESEEEKPYYDYDTLLSNGYKLRFGYNDTMQFLNLIKEGFIKEISTAEIGALPKNLGYIGADFKDYFAFIQSYGAGNAHFLQLIEKQNGIVVKKGYWIDFDKENNFLLYSDKDVPTQKDSLVMLNLNEFEEKKYAFPSDMLDSPQILNRIKIKKIDKDGFVIEYYPTVESENKKTKKYIH